MANASPIPTHYEILGVPVTASDDEITKAFRIQCKRVHPDADPEDKDIEVNALFRLVNDAYETLVDPLRRRDYDAQLQSGPPPTEEPNVEADVAAEQESARAARHDTTGAQARPTPPLWPTSLNCWPLTFGTPGQATSVSFGAVATRLGSEGEHVVAHAIDQADLGPGAVVFHGLVPPGGEGDCDHVIVMGNMMIVIDSKRWRAGRYETVTTDRTWERWDNGQRILETVSHVDAYRDGERWPKALLMGTGGLALRLAQAVAWPGPVHVLAALSNPGGDDSRFDLSNYDPPYVDLALTVADLPGYLARIATLAMTPVTNETEATIRLWKLCRDQQSVRGPFPAGWADTAGRATPPHKPAGTVAGYVQWASPIAVIGAVVTAATVIARAQHMAVLPLPIPAYTAAALALIAAWVLHDIKGATTSDLTVTDLRQAAQAGDANPPPPRSGPLLAKISTGLAFLGAAWLFVRGGRIYGADTVWGPAAIAGRAYAVLAVATLAVILATRRAGRVDQGADAWEAEWRAALGAADHSPTATSIAAVALAEDRAGTGEPWLRALERTGHQPARIFRSLVTARRASTGRPSPDPQTGTASVSASPSSWPAGSGQPPFLYGLAVLYGLLALSSLQAERFLSVFLAPSGLSGGDLVVSIAVLTPMAVFADIMFAHDRKFAGGHGRTFVALVGAVWLAVAVSAWSIGVLAIVAVVAGAQVTRRRRGPDAQSLSH